MHIAVLGGGISGLSTAYFLRRANRNIRVTLIESSSRFGGWLETVSTSLNISLNNVVPFYDVQILLNDNS